MRTSPHTDRRAYGLGGILADAEALQSDSEVVGLGAYGVSGVIGRAIADIAGVDLYAALGRKRWAGAHGHPARLSESDSVLKFR